MTTAASTCSFQSTGDLPFTCHILQQLLKLLGFQVLNTELEKEVEILNALTQAVRTGHRLLRAPSGHRLLPGENGRSCCVCVQDPGKS